MTPLIYTLSPMRFLHFDLINYKALNAESQDVKVLPNKNKISSEKYRNFRNYSYDIFQNSSKGQFFFFDWKKRSDCKSQLLKIRWL